MTISPSRGKGGHLLPYLMRVWPSSSFLYRAGWSPSPFSIYVRVATLSLLAHVPLSEGEGDHLSRLHRRGGHLSLRERMVTSPFLLFLKGEGGHLPPSMTERECGHLLHSMTERECDHIPPFYIGDGGHPLPSSTYPPLYIGEGGHLLASSTYHLSRSL